jgi:hypothetical protein
VRPCRRGEAAVKIHAYSAGVISALFGQLDMRE